MKLITSELKGRFYAILISIVILTALYLDRIVGILFMVTLWIAAGLFIIWTFRAKQKTRRKIQRAMIDTGLFTLGWIIGFATIHDYYIYPRTMKTARKLKLAVSLSALIYLLSAVGFSVYSFKVRQEDFAAAAFLFLIVPISILSMVFCFLLWFLIDQEQSKKDSNEG